MSKTLLLADDSATIQRVVELTFAQEDVRVVSVSDGEQAVRTIDRERPDIVLADVGMPELDGYAVAEHVKQSPQLRHIPVLLLTGAFEPIDEERAKRSVCDGVLIKPFEPRHLVSRVLELLALSSVVPNDATAGGAHAADGAGSTASPDTPVPVADHLASSLDLESLDGALSWTDEVKPIDVADAMKPAAHDPFGHAPLGEVGSLGHASTDALEFGGISPLHDSGGPATGHAHGGDTLEALEPPAKPVWNLASMSSIPSADAAAPDGRAAPPMAAHPPSPSPVAASATAPDHASSAPEHADEDEDEDDARVSRPVPPVERVAPPPALTPMLELPAPTAEEAGEAGKIISPASPLPGAPARAVVTSAPISLASAFAALLAAEQAHPAPPDGDAMTEADVEEVIRRVLVRVTDEVVRTVVQEAAERLIREEIERIKAAPDGQ